MTALAQDFDHRCRVRPTNAIQRKINGTTTDDSLDLFSPDFIVRFRVAEHMIRSELLQPFLSFGQIGSASLFRRSEDG